MKEKIPYIPEYVYPGNPPSRALNLKIDVNNWPASFPYSPNAEVSLWHSGETLFLNFKVAEDFISARCQNDNEKVSNDSCVEFFVSFDDEGYYNIEANCTGKILMSHRKGRKIDVKYAPEEILSLIERRPSLGSEAIECRPSDGEWQLLLKIPASAFFLNSINNFKGLKARCNFYKCGDSLPVPHYLSVYPISTESPDFHRPEFFGDIEFEGE